MTYTSIALVGVLVLTLDTGEIKVTTEPLEACRALAAAVQAGDATTLETEDEDTGEIIDGETVISAICFEPKP